MKRLIETALDWARKAEVLIVLAAVIALSYLGLVEFGTYDPYEPYEGNGEQ